VSRTVVISTSKLNRKGFRVLTAGGDLEQYKKNPILLFMHIRPWRGTSDEVLPLGTVKNVRVEGDDVIGDLDFDMEDPFARKVAAKWDKEIYRMVSAGITPVTFSDDPKYLVPGQRYASLIEWRLDEVSVVDIGANDDAIRIKNSEGKYISLSDEASDLSFIPLVNKQKTLSNMHKIATMLGLAADATEEMICDAIQKKDTEIAQLKGAESTLKLQAITASVDTAAREKRITESQKQHFIALGEKVGIELLNTTLAAIEPAVKPNDFIKNADRQRTEGQDKKWEDYSPEELSQLKDENPEAYALKYEGYYGFSPKLK